MSTVAVDRRGTLSIDGVWAAIAVLLPVSVTLLMRTQALDLAYQIRAGGLTLDDLAVLRTDVFTYTIAGQPWLNQQWAAQVLFAGTFRTGGWLGLDLLRGVMVGLTVLLIYRSCRTHGAVPRVAALLTLAGYLVANQVLAQLRPQLVGAVAFAVVVWLLSGREQHGERVWWVPAAVLVWANVHGSFPLVFALIGLAALDDAQRRPADMRRLGLVALVCAGVTFLNPFGPRVWAYVVDLVGNPVVAERIGEWGPPMFGTVTGSLFYVSLTAVVCLVIARRMWFGVTAIVGLVLFASMSLLAVRAAVWWALLAPVILAAVVARRPSREPVRDASHSGAGVVIVAALGGLVVVALIAGRGTDPVTGAPAMLSFAPERLVTAVRDAVSPGSRVFVSQLHASWSEFSAPELQVAVDSRVELFPEDVWVGYFVVSDGGREAFDLLERDEVRALILEPDQAAGLLEALPDHPEWVLLMETEDGSAFIRA